MAVKETPVKELFELRGKVAVPDRSGKGKNISRKDGLAKKRAEPVRNDAGIVKSTASAAKAAAFHPRLVRRYNRCRPPETGRSPGYHLLKIQSGDSIGKDDRIRSFCIKRQGTGPGRYCVPSPLTGR